MADLTYDILTDRQRFPDDMALTLADGSTVTVKQWRDAVLPKADFTKVTEAASRRERELQQAIDGHAQQVASLAAQLEEAKKAVPPARDAGTRRDGEYTDEELENDPILGRIFKRMKAHETALEQATTQLKTHESTWMRNHYTAQLGAVSKLHNERFNKDGKSPFDEKGFLDYVQRRPVLVDGQVDLGETYKGFSRDLEIEHLVKEAEARGVERGKEAARLPHIPMGRRRGPSKPEGLPEHLGALKDDDVLNDPEMAEAIRADMEG